MFLYLNQLRISSCRVFRGMYNNIWRINPSHLLIVIVEITFCNSNTGAKFWAVNVVSSHTLLLSTNFSCKIGMSTELMSSSDDPQLSSVYIVKHFDKKKFFSDIGAPKYFTHKIEWTILSNQYLVCLRKLSPAILSQISESLDKLCSQDIIRKVNEPTWS